MLFQENIFFADRFIVFYALKRALRFDILYSK